MADERDEYTRQLDDVVGDIRAGGWLAGTDGDGQRWQLDGLTFFRTHVGFDAGAVLAERELPMTWTGPTVHVGAAFFERYGFRARAARMRSEAAVRLFHRRPSWWMLGYTMRQAFLSAWYEKDERSW